MENNNFDMQQWAKDHLPSEEWEQLLVAQSQPLPISLRINQLKDINGNKIDQMSNRYGWATRPIPFTSHGYWIDDFKTLPSLTIEHKMGEFYIQEAASMLPPELFDFLKMDGQLILDMAAAPGGKTTHLLDRVHDKNVVIANDSSRSRLDALRIVIENWGAANQAITNYHGEWFGKYLPEIFDYVLVDAPCSMQGLRTTDSHPARSITSGEIETLANRQVNLLESALKTVKPGGQIVYATCTLTPQENEQVLDTVLRKHRHAIHIQNAKQILPESVQGLTKIGKKELSEEIKNALRLWPHTIGTAGFFCAKLIKTESLQRSENQWNSGKKTAFTGKPIPNSKWAHVTNCLENQFGIKINVILTTQNLVPVEIREKAYIIPRMIIERLQEISFYSLGMYLGKDTPKGWLPSHEFVSRFGHLFKKNIYVLENKYLEQWEKGGDIRGISSSEIPSGEFVLVKDTLGRNLGRGKILSNRLRNMLPTRLF